MLSKADALGVSTHDSLYQLGVSAYRLGLIDEAIAALAAGIQLNPDLPYLHIMLARCYTRTGNNALASNHDARALELLPSYWPSALAIGYTALNQGKIDAALTAYTLVASARPDLPEALYGLGIALIASNMILDGLEALIRARELAPENVAVLCAVTLAYLRVGKINEARAAVNEAIRLDPENVDVVHCATEVRQRSPR
jgi:tetratricopeptide (TPR) repeat protein